LHGEDEYRAWKGRIIKARRRIAGWARNIELEKEGVEWHVAEWKEKGHLSLNVELPIFRREVEKRSWSKSERRGSSVSSCGKV